MSPFALCEFGVRNAGLSWVEQAETGLTSSVVICGRDCPSSFKQKDRELYRNTDSVFHWDKQLWSHSAVFKLSWAIKLTLIGFSLQGAALCHGGHALAGQLEKGKYYWQRIVVMEILLQAGYFSFTAQEFTDGTVQIFPFYFLGCLGNPYLVLPSGWLRWISFHSSVRRPNMRIFAAVFSHPEAKAHKKHIFRLCCTNLSGSAVWLG